MLKILVYYILLLLILSSGAVFGTTVFGRRFEELLPIALVGYVFILFSFGLAGLLAFGFLFLCLLAAALYIVSVRRILCAGTAAAKILQRIFTPAAILFFLSLLVLFFINYDRPVSSIDELTHWADSAKAMFYTNTLGSAAVSGSNFPSYPPGMALFQYVFLKLYAALDPSTGYCEWVLYVAYQIFMLSFIFPFLKNVSLKKPVLSALAFLLIVTAPLMMDASAPFSSLYIDPFMSVVLGCGLAMVYSEPQKNCWYDLYIFCSCAVLVLVKPAGLLLSVFLAGAYAAELFSRLPDRKEKLRKVSCAAAGVFLPALLWSLSRKFSGVVQSFSGKEGEIDFGMMADLILHKGGDSWQQIVHDDYYHQLFTSAVRIKGFQCPYWLLFLSSLLFLFVMVRLLRKRSPELIPAEKTLIPAVLLIAGIYYVSMCYMYIFKFGWWEAIVLASFNRHVGIVLYAVYLSAVLVFSRFVLETEKTWRCLCLAALVFAVLVPFGRTADIAARRSVHEANESSSAFFSQYDELLQNVYSATNGHPSRVAFISQGERGIDFYCLHYAFRPNSTIRYGEWYLGPAPGPGFEDRMISADDYMHELTEKYDYLALCRIDDYFLENYFCLFAGDSPPEANTVYKISSQALLIKVNPENQQ